MPSSLVSLHFPFTGRVASCVGMPAEEVGPGLARLACLPIMAVGAAKGDVFRTRSDADGTLWAEEKVEASGHSVVRLCLVDDGPLGPRAVDTGEVLLGKFAPLGVTGDDFFGFALLDLPPDVDVVAVRRLLDDGVRARWWEYEELFVAESFRR